MSRIPMDPLLSKRKHIEFEQEWMPVIFWAALSFIRVCIQELPDFWIGLHILQQLSHSFDSASNPGK